MACRMTCNHRSSGHSSRLIRDGTVQLLEEALTIKISRPVCRRSSLPCRGEVLISRISKPTCLRYSPLCQDNRGNLQCSCLSNNSRQSCRQLAVFTARAIVTSPDTMLPLIIDQCLPVLCAASEAVSNMTLRLLKTTSVRLHGVEDHDSNLHQHLDVTSHGALPNSSSNKATSLRPQCRVRL